MAIPIEMIPEQKSKKPTYIKKAGRYLYSPGIIEGGHPVANAQPK
jgi:hypothetical protein